MQTNAFANATDFPPAMTQWVLENLLRDCTLDSMHAALVASGAAPELSARCINYVATSPITQSARAQEKYSRKLESVMLNMAQLQQFGSGMQTIERRSNLSLDELHHRYFAANRPVIVTDLSTNWPLLNKWTLEYFKAEFGGVEVQVQYGRDTTARYEEVKHTLAKRLPFGAYLDEIAVGASNNAYMTANNEALKTGPLAQLLGDIGPLPDYLVPERLAQDAFLWVGPAGTVTPLHHDTVHLFHLQVVGRKRWRLVPSLQTPLVYNHSGVFSQVDIENVDLARFPKFKDAVVMDVIVEPGEAIFLPLAWWHHVRALDTSISLSLANVRLPGAFEFANPG